jgi:Flp pilus assembly protein TadG
MKCLATQPLIGIRQRLAGLTKACDGTAAVEAAVALMPFLLLVFGLIEGGLLVWTQSNLQFAVEAAARCAAASAAGNTTVCGNPANIQSYAASQVVGLPVTAASFTVLQGAASSCGGTGTQVSIVYPYSSNGFIVPALFSGAINLNATSCHP